MPKGARGRGGVGSVGRSGVRRRVEVVGEQKQMAESQRGVVQEEEK